MKRALFLSVALLALGGCREDGTAVLPAPVTMTAEAVGHFCQMEMLEHPGPKAQVFLDGLPYPLFFSQVRDAIAYDRMPEQSHMITAIYVSDMGAPGATWEDPGADNWILADVAHYVAGSDRAGGMETPELVPFATLTAAQDFVTQHGGAILHRDAIADDLVLAPVVFEGDSGIDHDDGDLDKRLRALTRGPEG
ncbi:nitrous oxide reductase accessory protein NosL [Roseinatronobacter alkalisoli]|uniref:Nitrous oxide reductase accessory protein NosL n=1 Tax=Roseinatronobacter alkalisoli TaxID=3028235 RepID=A0ABT5TC86_9RHOB|nr:nitrous oxide reductase accessory protein NosL [Roseinatronobacter sp. HJB301]MDD7972305.1 nitrous oxide reductase accessory protein NosL [Roseinatronobacter sp. HJB301]